MRHRIHRTGLTLLGVAALCVLASCASNQIQRPTDNTPPSGMREGCFIDVYENPNFKGQFTRFWGPGAYLNLNQGGRDWARKISAVIVGPNAHVRVTDNKGPGANVLWLVPDQRVSDLGKLNFNDKIETMEIVDRDPGLGVPVVR